MSCSHGTWHNPRGSGSPLACARCGVPWPGEVLPVPFHQTEGYGHVAEQPGFNRRLRTALTEVAADVERAGDASP